MKFIYNFNTHDDIMTITEFNKDNIVLCKDPNIDNWHSHFNYKYDSQISFLESTGTQYIDCEYIPKGTTKIELKSKVIDCAFNSISGNYRLFMPLFGAVDYNSVHNKFWAAYVSENSTSSTKHLLYYYNSGGTQIYVNYKPQLTSDAQVKVWFTHSFNRNDVYRNGSQLQASGTNPADSSSINYSMYLFSVNANTNTKVKTGTSKLQVEYFRIKDENDNLIRDFIPVRVGTIGYMYDKVSQRLFRNKGTGDFVLGPDIT